MKNRSEIKHFNRGFLKIRFYKIITDEVNNEILNYINKCKHRYHINYAFKISINRKLYISIS